ncbi:MAG: Mur ligase domain-containing protein, partial [Saccharospirillum sp.]
MMPLHNGLPGIPELSGLAVRDLTLDSREVGRKDVFIALKGAAVDGHDYIDAAVKAGAVAVIAEHPVTGTDVPVVVVSDLKARLGE